LAGEPTNDAVAGCAVQRHREENLIYQVSLSLAGVTTNGATAGCAGQSHREVSQVSRLLAGEPTNDAVAGCAVQRHRKQNLIYQVSRSLAVVPANGTVDDCAHNYKLGEFPNIRPKSRFCFLTFREKNIVQNMIQIQTI
jgi:hypothetical protein